MVLVLIRQTPKCLPARRVTQKLIAFTSGPVDYQIGANVQTRLLACLAGGLLGVVLASAINDGLGLSLSPTLAVIACSSAGVGLGYVVSILFDVFSGAGKSHSDSLKS